jgi:hypothetical protein
VNGNEMRFALRPSVNPSTQEKAYNL